MASPRCTPGEHVVYIPLLFLARLGDVLAPRSYPLLSVSAGASMVIVSYGTATLPPLLQLFDLHPPRSSDALHASLPTNSRLGRGLQLRSHSLSWDTVCVMPLG